MKKFFEYFIKVIKILQEADRDSQKKKIRKKKKRESDYFNPSGPIPPMGLGGGLGG